MTSGVMYEKNVSAKIVTNPEFSIPDVSPEEITVSSVSAIRGAVLAAGESLIKGQGMLTSVVKIGIKASAEIPFTAGRVGKAGSGSHLHKFSSYKCYIFKSSILNLNH